MVCGEVISSRFDDLPASPFQRLGGLLQGAEPGAPVIDMAVGEPKHAVPDFIAEVLRDYNGDFNRYPPARGTEQFRCSVAGWLNRRYRLNHGIDPDHHVLPVSGTREALFSIALVAAPRQADAGNPAAMMMPNPFYQCYLAGAVAAGLEPVFLDAPRDAGFLPDLDALSENLLARTALYYLCSPANPQGAVADIDYLSRLLALSRRHGFTVVSDECYSEIYNDQAPPGMLEAVDRTGGDLTNVLVFNSLSKRSSLAGLRCGFCAGDPDLIERFFRFRNLAGPQVPIPVQAAGAAAWDDEEHVVENRRLYRDKWALAETILDGRFGFYRADGGFFLWLDMGAAGGGEKAAWRAWRDAGLRTLPGRYLARPGRDGHNPADRYLRLALVHDIETTGTALRRLAKLFEETTRKS